MTVGSGIRATHSISALSFSSPNSKVLKPILEEVEYLLRYMTLNNRQTSMTKPPIIILVAAVVMTMISFSIISMTHAQQEQISGSKSGTIASLQYGRVSYKYPARVLWILSG